MGTRKGLGHLDEAGEFRTISVRDNSKTCNFWIYRWLRPSYSFWCTGTWGLLIVKFRYAIKTLVYLPFTQLAVGDSFVRSIGREGGFGEIPGFFAIAFCQILLFCLLKFHLVPPLTAVVFQARWSGFRSVSQFQILSDPFLTHVKCPCGAPYWLEAFRPSVKINLHLNCYNYATT